MATRPGTATVTLPSDTQILITRSFEAPLALVWDLLHEPRHVLRWWGPDWCPLVSAEIDLRVGGSWRYVARMADGGAELGWHGTYREIEAPHRVVSTEVFEGFPDAESVNTVTLTEHDGVTTMQTLVQHQSPAHRDGHLESGMEGGMQITFNRLDDLLAAAGSASERFRRVAGRFTDRVEEVPADGWERPAPCDGWVARDIVRHVTEWMPSMLSAAGIDAGGGPSVDDDPAGAWRHLAGVLQGSLDDPAVAGHEFHVGPPGVMPVERAIDMLMTGDLLIHTWDLARATGLDERIDETIASEMLQGMQSIDELLRSSGHYGPKVEVPADAGVVERLIGFVGRDPRPMAP